MSQEDESSEQANQPNQQGGHQAKKARTAENKVQTMRPPQIVPKSKIMRDQENPLSKRSRQRNNKRNKLKQANQQNWKQTHYGNNRHKNNNSSSTGSTTKNNNKDEQQQQHKANARSRNVFVNATFTMGRKRAMTFPGLSKFFLPYKRPRKECIIPPTKFLLGGNISDPLNLNSLHDEENGNVNKEAEVPAMTPEAATTVSPREEKCGERRDSTASKKEDQKYKTDGTAAQPPADENLNHNLQQQHVSNPPVPNTQHVERVQVIVPPNMFDPLNLLHPHEEDAEYEKKLALSSPVKKKPRNRTNRRRKASKANTSSASTQDGNSSATSIDNSSDNKDSNDVFVYESNDVVKKEEISDKDDKESENLKSNEGIAHGEQDSIEQTDSPVTASSSIASSTNATTTNTNCLKELKLDLSATSSIKSISSTKDSISGQRKQRRLDSMDKIVSPVIPQPGAWMRPHRVDKGGQRGSWRGRGRGRGSNNNSSNITGNTSSDITMDSTDIVFNSTSESTNTEAPQTTEQDSSMTCTNDEPEIDKSLPDEEKHSSIDVDEKKEEIDEASFKKPNFKKDGKRYQHGNYDRYYGYRNLNESMDVRLKVFQMHKHLFQGRDILDIGCNVGHVSLCVSRDLGARSVTGIDIDGKLIERAKKNLRQYVTIHKNQPSMPAQTVTSQTATESNKNIENTIDCQKQNSDDNAVACTKIDECCDKDNKKVENTKKSVKIAKLNKFNKWKKNRLVQNTSENYFPISFPLLYGPVDVLDNTEKESTTQFPYNVVFKHANYVLKDDNLISAEPAQFDLILCLSVSKWLHLNNGDAGLKRAFKRMFAQLRPGGKLILEAQNWASYKKKKNLTETIYNNYRSIEFFPCKFRDYLLSPEVGFSQCSVLGVPQHLSKGFRRPIQLYIKGDFTPSQAMWSDTRMPSASHYAPQMNTPSARRPVYTAPLPDIKSGSMFSYWGSTPYSLASHHTNNIFDTSPFYAPGSGSYTPSYSEGRAHPGQRNVYAPTCGTRWSSPATTAGTPSQSPAQFVDLTPNATPNATPRSQTPGYAGWHDSQQSRNVTRVYAAVSPDPGTSYSQNQSSPQYLPQWNESNGDYYASGESPNTNEYSPQEDTSSNDQLVANESSSASMENSPSVHSASFRSGDSPSTHDDMTILNGHAHATSPRVGDCDSTNASPVSNS